MSTRVVINPVTRISGFMEIAVNIKDGITVSSRCTGFLYRGFEQMLEGRSPLDTVYFTERICGICSAAHSTVASLALEDAFGISPSLNGRILRDLVHGCEFLQNHIRHFYQFVVPDYVYINELAAAERKDADYRLPDRDSEIIANHYFASLEMSRKAHEMLAVFGGKAPHNHGIFVGGITESPTVDKITKFRSLLSRIRWFVEEAMLPDALTIARYYKDYFSVGRGPGNLLSYGLFCDYPEAGNLYLNSGVLLQGKKYYFNPALIQEDIVRSWYDNEGQPYPVKEDAYTWVKAVRYNGFPCETGPLARMYISGEYTHGISVMDRIMARALETKKIALIMERLLEMLIPGESEQIIYKIPDRASGLGLCDTTRGALLHQIDIQNGKISSYRIITPSVWNCSPRDNKGIMGPMEQALTGVRVNEPENPVELGRIVRSFDPCISCATHVYCDNIKTGEMIL